jgi:hypothetical protein
MMVQTIGAAPTDTTGSMNRYVAALGTWRGLLVAVVVVGVLAIVAAVAGLAPRGDSPTGGAFPVLDVRQSGSATDNGLVIVATRAGFSGTATFIELQVQPATGEGTAGDAAVRAIIDPAQMSLDGTSADHGPGGFNEPLGSPGIVRLPTVSLRGEAALRVSSVTLLASDGSPPKSVTGKWIIPLDLPGDLASRLRVEHLRGQSAESAGIAVSIQGAVRSTSETLLTVRIEANDAVGHVGQPSMTAGGRLLWGGLLASREGGRLLTFTFPPTPFGSAVEVSFGPFERAQDRTSGTVEIDLAAPMSRAGISGKENEKASISPSDVIRRDGTELVPTLLEFSEMVSSSGDVGGKFPLVRLTFDGSFPPSSGTEPSWSAVTRSGTSLALDATVIGYSKDATGAVCCPRTEVWFRYEKLDDLQQPVIVSYRGDPTTLIRGDWKLTLEP